MKKNIFWFLICLLWTFSAFCEEAENVADVQIEQTEQPAENPTELIHYSHFGELPEIKELEESEDDLYSGSDVKPMEARISEEEKLQDLNTDLDYVNKEFIMPELSCNNEKLTNQVALFIKNRTDDKENSVKGRRNRILMVKNLHNFEEIKEDDVDKSNFNLRAVLMHLRINENREIYKICESKGNKYGKFNNVYLLLYPYYKYYKVVVTNLISTPEKAEDATFIFNW